MSHEIKTDEHWASLRALVNAPLSRELAEHYSGDEEVEVLNCCRRTVRLFWNAGGRQTRAV